MLDNFWGLADEAFALAGQGHEDSARYLIRSQLEEQRETISRVVSHLLSLNDQAQQEAGQRVSLVYGQVSKDILLLIGVLFLVALGTGTLHAASQPQDLRAPAPPGGKAAIAIGADADALLEAD